MTGILNRAAELHVQYVYDNRRVYMYIQLLVYWKLNDTEIVLTVHINLKKNNKKNIDHYAG